MLHAGPKSSAENPERIRVILASLPAFCRKFKVFLSYKNTIFRVPLDRQNCSECTFQLEETGVGVQCSVCGCLSANEWKYCEEVDGDTTYMTPFTDAIVGRAEKMVEIAAQDFLEKTGQFTFCLSRPPGHHACQGKRRGFCHKNFAITALDYFWSRGKSCVILDIDAHFGDGTVAELDKRPYGAYVSIHGFGKNVYPGTGDAVETARILSLPLPPDSGNSAWLDTFQNKALPFMRKSGADIVIVSAGFDAHKADVIAPLRLNNSAFMEIGKELRLLGKPVFVVLEGGYNLDTLGHSVSAFIQGFC